MTMAKTPRNAEISESNEGGNAGAATEVSANDVNLEATRGVVDKRLDKINEKNAEGHEKNMKAIEEAHADNEVGKPDPKLGREDNGNTPRIDKNGNKTWLPPGVAGAVR